LPSQILADAGAARIVKFGVHLVFVNNCLVWENEKPMVGRAQFLFQRNTGGMHQKRVSMPDSASGDESKATHHMAGPDFQNQNLFGRENV